MSYGSGYMQIDLTYWSQETSGNPCFGWEEDELSWTSSVHDLVANMPSYETIDIDSENIDLGTFPPAHFTNICPTPCDDAHYYGEITTGWYDNSALCLDLLVRPLYADDGGGTWGFDTPRSGVWDTVDRLHNFPFIKWSDATRQTCLK